MRFFGHDNTYRRKMQVFFVNFAGGKKRGSASKCCQTSIKISDDLFLYKYGEKTSSLQGGG